MQACQAALDMPERVGDSQSTPVLSQLACSPVMAFVLGIAALSAVHTGHL